MYAVIKTGGKQYRVRAGDLLVVEKLDGEPGAKIAFDEVMMIGEGPQVTVGAPMIEGALVSATLVETRKGEKIKVFKKIRRQGYRRTRGHRQFQSVLRVTGISGDGRTETWDGSVDLTPLSVLNARARNLARGMEAAEAKRAEKKPVELSEPVKAKAAKAKPAKAKPAKAKPAKAKPAKVPKPAAKTVAPKSDAPPEAKAAPSKPAPKARAAVKAAAPKKPAAAAKKDGAAAKKPAAKPAKPKGKA
ncbi:MAG: 50S ribosomal protein L21 [Caulobacteraceae bacterium]|nr:50S ribosomal protein L21 [Caulobacteraceae bacterium]